MSRSIPDVKSVFGKAIAIPVEADRAAYLDVACAEAPEVRAEVQGLLDALGKAGSFMQSPAAPRMNTESYESPISEGVGTVIGPYKLMEQIGEGGMGLVFVASQQEPIRRRVALKIIKPGMDSKQVVARFEAERQALAMMDHQNIARVFDAGTTQSGRPYFVMELVHGVPITTFCDENKLTPRERLELFVSVCQAVQHAHQKGIIHRDLKPSNILVTMYDDKPVPKVIDFGVAKAIEQRLTEKTVYTQFGTLVGTFEYMSPEQAEMNAFGVDTRSDIYSLGVLLYELLTGTTPLERKRLREAAFDEIRRIIKEEEPPRPSVRLSTSGALAKVAAARKTEPAKLSRLVRGELDWVVMRCLEKDRARRYETANALARDIERYLRDEPVEACPPTAGYRLRKFARKHKKPLAVAGAFALLTLIGLALVIWKWQDERVARRDAVIAQLDAENKTKEIQESVARMNEASAAMDLGGLYAELGIWPLADAEFTRATGIRPDHTSVWINRGNFYARLGLWDLVAEDYGRAFALRESDNWLYWYNHALLSLETGDDSGYRRLCARGLEHFGALTNGKVPTYLVRMCNLAPDAVPNYDGVTRLAPPRGPGVRSTWFELYLVGAAHYRAGRFEQAVSTLRRSLEATQHQGRTMSYPILAMSLYRSDAIAEARKELSNARQVLDEWTQSVFQNPATFVPTRFWRDWVECRLLYREAHQLIEKVPPPEDARLRILRGRAFASLGRPDQAAPEYARAVRLARDDYSIRRAAFQFYADARRWADADAELTAMKRLRPKDPHVCVVAFRAFATNGKWDRADEEHAVAIRLRPEDFSLRLERFRYHLDRGESKEADAAYAKVTRDRENDIPFRIKLGDACTGLKQWAKARDEYARILDAGVLGDGEINRDTWLRLACLQLYFDDVKAYRRTCRRLVEQYESHDDFRYLIALVRICLLHPDPGVTPARIAEFARRLDSKGGDPSKGLHGEAIISLRVGKEVDQPALQRAFNRHRWATQQIALARVDHARGDFHSARTRMNQVNVQYRRVDPSASTGRWDFDLETQLWYRQAEAVIQSARWNVVDDLIKQQKWAAAIDAFGTLLKPEDKSASDWGHRGFCCAALGRWKEAAADFARSHSLGGNYVPGFRMHCLAALQIGDKDTYCKLCRDALERFATSSDRNVLNTVAWLCALDPAAEAEVARAVELVDKALKQSTYNTYVHTRACLLYRAKHYDEALKQLNQLIAQPGYPVNAYDWLFLAMTHQRLGQKEQAVKYLNQSTAWMTTNTRDWQQRAELERFRAEAEALIHPKK